MPASTTAVLARRASHLCTARACAAPRRDVAALRSAATAGGARWSSLRASARACCLRARLDLGGPPARGPPPAVSLSPTRSRNPRTRACAHGTSVHSTCSAAVNERKVHQ
eukprot:6213762-Pleurochrysis_carterae.AAC.4